MSTYSDLQSYGISKDQAWRMLPVWAQRELERRHDRAIPLSAMIDALAWPAPPERPAIEEELRWIAVYGASAWRSARQHIRLIRAEPRRREIYLIRLRALRTAHSQLMARRGFLLRLAPRATGRAAA